MRWSRRISTIAKPTRERPRVRSKSHLRRLALIKTFLRDLSEDFPGELSHSPSHSMREIEDLRSVPDEFRETRFLTLAGRPAGIVYVPEQSGTTHASPLRDVLPAMYARFQNPSRTLVCIRRKNRRRVLFAMRKMAKSNRRFKRPVWSAKSYISCK